MSNILSIITEYEGNGLLLILYGAALVFLFLREDDRVNRTLFLYMPLCMLVVLLLPPVYRLYTALDGSDTYYRLFWLIPIAVTIGYAVVRQFATSLKIGVVVGALLIVLCGTYVYHNENLVKAQNRLHIPQEVIDVADYILRDSGGKRCMVAMPDNMVQFVRQYDSRILMPYGREMLMPQWADYYQAVYETVNAETVDPDALIEALREYNCNYLVMSAEKMAGVDLGGTGLLYLDSVDGYNIYRDPAESQNLMDTTPTTNVVEKAE